MLRAPRSDIGQAVTAIWHASPSEEVAGSQIVLPTGDVDLVADVSGGGAMTVIGPSTRPRRVVAVPRSSVGVVLRQGSAALILGVPVSELRDEAVPMSVLWGSSAERLHEALCRSTSYLESIAILESDLRGRLRASTVTPHPLAAIAAGRIARAPETCRVDVLSDRLGLTPRRLQQIFRVELGVSPKAFARLQRFRAALRGIERAREIGWAGYALERGYHDQSHFITEFRRHAGVTPAIYLEIHDPRSNHLTASL